MDTILQVKDLCKKYEDFALDHVSFTLPRGCIMGFIGENGAGKSTLMKCLFGMYKKDSGHIYLEGKEFEPTNPKVSKAAGIAFVHQELNLFTNLTVYENLFITEMKNPSHG